MMTVGKAEFAQSNAHQANTPARDARGPGAAGAEAKGTLVVLSFGKGHRLRVRRTLATSRRFVAGTAVQTLRRNDDTVRRRR